MVSIIVAILHAWLVQEAGQSAPFSLVNSGKEFQGVDFNEKNTFDRMELTNKILETLSSEEKSSQARKKYPRGHTHSCAKRGGVSRERGGIKGGKGRS